MGVRRRFNRIGGHARARERLRVAGELAQVGRLQRDLVRARQQYERELAQFDAGVGWLERVGAAGKSRSACFQDLRDLGLSADQARRIVRYIDEHRLVQLEEP